MKIKGAIRKYKRSICSFKHKTNIILAKKKFIKNINMNEDHLVSVVMTVFNREKYVELAIKSVLNQSYKNIELIIVNDGSTDSSESIIKSFNDKRIKYFSKENTGQLDTFKYAYKKATGDYVTRVDSDDIVDKDFILLCINEVSKNSKLQFIYFNLFNIDKDNNLLNIAKMNKYDSGIDVLRDIFEKFYSVIPDVAFWRKDYVKNIDEFYINRNIPFYINDIDKIQFEFIDLPLYFYRVHEENYASNIDNLRFVISGIISTAKFIIEKHKEKIFKETGDELKLIIANRYFKEALKYIDGEFNGATFTKKDKLYSLFIVESKIWIEKIENNSLQEVNEFKNKLAELI